MDIGSRTLDSQLDALLNALQLQVGKESAGKGCKREGGDS